MKMRMKEEKRNIKIMKVKNKKENKKRNENKLKGMIIYYIWWMIYYINDKNIKKEKKNDIIYMNKRRINVIELYIYILMILGL